MTERLSIGQMFPNISPPVANRKAFDSPISNPSVPPRSFQQILDENVVRLSQHAETRLQQRGILILPEQMEKIQAAIDKAASKGAKESLVLMDNIALIVNVRNRTIVTALDGSSMKDNVFTKIDSAIII